MRFAEAFEELEKYVSKFKLKNRFGDQLTSSLALAKCFDFKNDLSESWFKKLERNEITPKEFYDKAKILIDDAVKAFFILESDRKINKI